MKVFTGPVTIHVGGIEVSDFRNLLEQIIMNQDQLAQQLTEVTAQVTKIGAESRTLLTRIDDLTSALNGAGEVTAEVAAALDALKAQVAVVDALVPDVSTETPAGV